MKVYCKILLNTCLLTCVALVMMFILSQHVFAAELIEEYDVSASTEDSVVAELYEDEDGLIIEISGTGRMRDFNHGSEDDLPPWGDYMGDIVSVIVKHGVTHIGDIAFQECGYVQTISLPNGLESIGDEAFTCHCCEEIIIPSSVKTIGKNAFVEGQTDYYFRINGSETVFDSQEPPFDLESGINVTVLAYEDSKVVADWSIESDFVTLDVLPSYEYNDDKTEIRKYLANGVNITIPDGVQTVGENAFAGKTDLNSVKFNEVVTIKQYAFSGCIGLTGITVPKTVKTIEDGAFSGCDNLSVIYGNKGSVGESLAEELQCEFVALKPYLIDKDQSVLDKEMPVGTTDTVKLNGYFKADYNTELTFQVKEGTKEYQNLDSTEFVFDGAAAGNQTFTFRAMDSDGEFSEDELTLNYTVVNNAAPVRASGKDGINIITTLGKQVDVDITGVFEDPDGDALTYKIVELSGEDSSEANWDDASELIVNNGLFTTNRFWTLFVSDLGKEKTYIIKAFDKWNIPSNDYYTLSLTMYGTIVRIAKGEGIHDLSTISFSFEREGADPITKPVKVKENDYYFNLDYQVYYPYGPNMAMYQDGYDYTYKVSLADCDDVTGSYSTLFNADENMIEVTLSNPEQAAKDKQAVANVIDLIDNLGDIALDSEEAVNAAQAAYEALYDDLKPQVTNYEVLHLSKLVLSSLKAQKAAEEARNAALTAQAEAEKAQSNADKAKQDAEAAKKAAEDAKADALAAKEDAETAKGEAEAAQLAAETAQAKAEEEQRKANEAKLAAETAKAEAEAAQAKAKEAQGKAEAAQQKAENAAQEASSSDSDTAQQIKELQETLEKTAAELAALKDTLAAKENKVAGLKLKSKARKITVTWKKNADADGYQVQFKLKSAKKYKTLKTLTGIKAVSKKLKKGKKYQFRVATYKTVDGKKIYGKWVTKTVKCK